VGFWRVVRCDGDVERRKGHACTWSFVSLAYRVSFRAILDYIAIVRGEKVMNLGLRASHWWLRGTAALRDASDDICVSCEDNNKL
jgi:hypothetical protein